MNPKRNYQREMDDILHAAETPPHVLLHACCAPCSSAVLERMAEQAEITLFFYNPNILPEEEYRCRLEELKRLLSEMGLSERIRLMEGKYEPERFLAFAQALKDEPERGLRCQKCIRMRLMEAAKIALQNGADFFTSTLTISPHKDAEFINQTGFSLAEDFGIAWLPSDFKKKNGYQRSIELSGIYCLYRQNYCGCPFSRRSGDTSTDVQS